LPLIAAGNRNNGVAMGIIGNIGRSLKNAFNAAGETAFANAGAAAYIAGAEAIAALNQSMLLPQKLDNDRKELLRADFGDLVDEVRLRYGAQLIELTILGRRVGTNPDGQTFGDRIYLAEDFRAGDDDQLELIAHELVHSKQWKQAGSSLWEFGKRYFREYYRAGFDYDHNIMEEEADDFAGCFIERVGSSVQHQNVWSSSWETGWSSIVPFRFGTEVFVLLYNATTGAVEFRKVRPAGDGVDRVWQDPNGWSKGWTTFMPFILNGAPHCLSYKSANGLVHIYRFNAGGNGYILTGTAHWTSGWTAIMPFRAGGRPYYLAYKAGTGAVSIGKIRMDGSGVDSVWSDKWRKGWTSFHPFVHGNEPHYLAYKIAGGAVAIDSIDRVNGEVSGVTTVWSGDWSGGWTTFAPLSTSGKDFLVHKGEQKVQIGRGLVPVPGSGRAHVGKIGNPANGTTTEWCAQWRGSWKCATSFQLPGGFHTLFYGADGDDVSISQIVA
jgi:hypothetical protein